MHKLRRSARTGRRAGPSHTGRHKLTFGTGRMRPLCYYSDGDILYQPNSSPTQHVTDSMLVRYNEDPACIRETLVCSPHQMDATTLAKLVVDGIFCRVLEKTGAGLIDDERLQARQRWIRTEIYQLRQTRVLKATAFARKTLSERQFHLLGPTSSL